MLLGGGGTMSGLESIGSRIPSFFFRPYLHFYLSDLAQILGISRSEGPLEEYIGFLVRVVKMFKLQRSSIYISYLGFHSKVCLYTDYVFLSSES